MLVKYHYAYNIKVYERELAVSLIFKYYYQILQADFVSQDYDDIGVNNGHDAKLIKTIKSGVSFF